MISGAKERYEQNTTRITPEMKEQDLTLIDRFELPDEKMLSLLRAMTPAKRLETVFYLARLARKMMWAQAASAHPEWTTEQIQEDIARRTLRGAK